MSAHPVPQAMFVLETSAGQVVYLRHRALYELAHKYPRSAPPVLDPSRPGCAYRNHVLHRHYRSVCYRHQSKK